MALKYLYAPIGYKAGKTYGVLPNVANADLAFVRASGATRINSSKLIDKGESISPNDFAPINFSSGWTGQGSGMTLSTGAAVFNNSAESVTANIRTNSDITLGKSYRIIIEVTSFTSAGGTHGLYYYSANGITNFPVEGVGTYEYTFTVKETRTFVLNSYTGTSLTVGSVSLKEITTENLNTPRLDYTDNTYPTLLVEPTRTNLKAYSDRGQYGNLPASAAQTLAPDGTNMATIPIPNADADRYTHIAQAATYTSGTKLTYSWYRKRLSTPVVSTYTGDLHIKGLINCTQVGDTIQIETNINGYDRFSATFSLDFSLNTDYTNAYLRGYFGEIIGTGNSSIAYFGHQVEVGEYATSYIPTSGVAVTRPAETGLISGDLSSYLNSSEGVLEIRAKALFNGGDSERIGISDGSVNNRRNLIWSTSANTMQLGMKANGSNVFDGGATFYKSFTHDQTQMATFKIKWKSGDIQVKLNDTIVITDTGTFTILGLDRIRLDAGYGSASNLFEGNVQYIKAYDTAKDF